MDGKGDKIDWLRGCTSYICVTGWVVVVVVVVVGDLESVHNSAGIYYMG